MILNCFLCASLVPNPVTDNTTNTRRIITAKHPANVTKPSPHARPVAIAKNTTDISLALPGAERNLTKAKAPAIENALATLLPTRRITDATIAGKRARPIIKLLLYPSFFDTSVYTKAITKPITTATNIPNIDWLMLIVFSDVDVKIDSNIYFLLYTLSLCNS